jgi:mRNA-degrading endonuclease RelE of RelBE toxin-antitoxin system
MYDIEVSNGALGDLAKLRAYDRTMLLDEIERILTTEPAKPSRNKKILVGLNPPFDSVPPVRELRVVEYRVFYDVAESERKVYVRAVRRKPPHQTTEAIL